MSDKTNSSKAIELMHLGFNVSIDLVKCQDDLEEIIETARMFNSTLILKNVPDSLLNEKSLKILKKHSHKIIIEI